MDNDQKDKYIELLEAFKTAVTSRRQGWYMDELKALRDLQDFEDSLPCNQIESVSPWTPQPGDVEISERI